MQLKNREEENGKDRMNKKRKNTEDSERREEAKKSATVISLRRALALWLPLSCPIVCEAAGRARE